jgi:RNA polymerase sigma factor (sigma-70 family)
MHNEADTDADCDAALVRAACLGDRAAQQRLCASCLPKLRRWALHWLPRTHAGINDAEDLVQIALMRVLHRLGEFEVRGENCFLAYLRQVLINEVRSELRKQRCRGENVELDPALPAHDGDPVLGQMLGHERACAYAGALNKLNRRQRQHVALRIEYGMSFGEIAAQTGGNADSARMIVARALRSMSQSLAPAGA